MEFSRINFFKKFPNLKPFVGKTYSRYKILIVGESHFLRQDFKNQISDDFYKGDESLLGRGVYENILSLDTTYECSKDKLHNIHRNLSGALKEVGLDYQNIAYYNFFLKPAVNGMSIIPTDLDRDVANCVFAEIIAILQPKLIVFVSRKSFDHFKKTTKVNIVPHPTCSWWNRKSRKYQNRTGREKFICLMKHSLNQQ